MRKLFAIVAACLMSMGANAACGDNYDELYTNLPFEMNKVTRPQFPDNEVNLRDFGAVGDGSSLCTDAFSFSTTAFFLSRFACSSLRAPALAALRASKKWLHAARKSFHNWSPYFFGTIPIVFHSFCRAISP